MGHGHHWGAVLNSVEENFGQILNAGVSGGGVIGKRQLSDWPGPLGFGDASVTLIENARGGFGVLSIIVSDSSSPTYLHSAFPGGGRGQAHLVEIIDVSEASFGLEACIIAGLGEARLRFFDPYYALNAKRYRSRGEVNVALSGIAYAWSGKSVGVFDRGQRVDWLRNRWSFRQVESKECCCSSESVA